MHYLPGSEDDPLRIAQAGLVIACRIDSWHQLRMVSVHVCAGDACLQLARHGFMQHVLVLQECESSHVAYTKETQHYRRSSRCLMWCSSEGADAQHLGCDMRRRHAIRLQSTHRLYTLRHALGSMFYYLQVLLRLSPRAGAPLDPNTKLRRPCVHQA